MPNRDTNIEKVASYALELASCGDLPEDRQWLESELLRILLERTAFLSYTTFLRNACKNLPSVELPFDDIVGLGLGILSDDALVALAVDASALEFLQELLEDGIIMEDFKVAEEWCEQFQQLHRAPELNIHEKNSFIFEAFEKYGTASDLKEFLAIPDVCSSSEPTPSVNLNVRSVARDICSAFEIRSASESNALDKCFHLPDSEFQLLLDSLQLINDKMASSDGESFLTLDKEFHRRLCKIQNPEIVDSCRIIFDLGALATQSFENRDAVCKEHQELIAAMRNFDSEGAAVALRCHFNNAYRRYFPPLGAVAKNNQRYYDLMQSGDCLSWVSANIPPIEMSPKYWRTVGRAAARAVNREAKFRYYWPKQSLFDRWAKCWMKDMVATQQQMIELMEKFRCSMMSELCQLGVSVKDASTMVLERVSLVFLDDDELFNMAVDKTIGYFRYDNSPDRYTERYPLNDNCAWEEIDEPHDSELRRRHFLYALSGSLKRAAQSGQVDSERYLRELPSPSLDTRIAKKNGNQESSNLLVDTSASQIV